MVSNRFGVPKQQQPIVSMNEYLEKREYLKRVKKQGKWQSVGGAAPVSIGKVGLLPDVNEGEVPEEVRVKPYTERRTTKVSQTPVKEDA